MKSSERIEQLDCRIEALEEEDTDRAGDMQTIWDRVNKLEEETKSGDKGEPTEYVMSAGRGAIHVLKELRGYVDGELHELTTNAIDKLEDALDKW